jgi:hypothetical protein
MQYRRRYEWVKFPEGDDWNPDYAGFRAKVLVNPSGSELHEETRLFHASDGVKQDEGLTAEQLTAATRAAQDEYFQYVADRVPEWEYEAETVNGEILPVPAPGEHEGNWQAFYLLEWPLCIWLRNMIHYAHLPKVRAMLAGEVSVNGAGSTDSTPTTPTPLRPKSSSRRSASASTA